MYTFLLDIPERGKSISLSMHILTETVKQFSKVNVFISSLRTIYESSSCSTSSPKLGVFNFVGGGGGGHSDTGAEISNSEFNLHLPNE